MINAPGGIPAIFMVLAMASNNQKKSYSEASKKSWGNGYKSGFKAAVRALYRGKLRASKGGKK